VKPVFGDSLYFLALANPRDAYHERALQFARNWRGVIVTTRWVLAEVCDGLSGELNRHLAVHLVDQAATSRQFRVVLGSDELFERGLDLYRRRGDKDWSLTDCISFVVMQDEGLTESLTGDRHFEQAGFVALLTDAARG
jgi:predicted nucleic acid-binding protein